PEESGLSRGTFSMCFTPPGISTHGALTELAIRVGPRVRIWLAPADSPCLAGYSPPTSKSRAFPVGVRGGAGSAVGRDGRGAVIWRRRAAISLSGQIPVPQRR